MISVALPVHNMKRSRFFLTRCLDSLLAQSYTDFEVIVTDNSEDDQLLKLCRTYGMDIKHFFNKRKGMAQNTNEAIQRSTGHLIKVLYMDDHLAYEDALYDIVGAFKGHWLITAADNNRSPRYTDNIEMGNNKLGSPSALTILNDKPLLFDEEMTWLLDCDYYKRMYEAYGEPTILKKVGVNIGTGSHQMTHLLTQEEKQLEERYIINKYEY